jgi:hypothetical protein
MELEFIRPNFISSPPVIIFLSELFALAPSLYTQSLSTLSPSTGQESSLASLTR